MTSIFNRATDSAKFRLRWLGYDRAEVDEFLRQTQADRQQLQEDLAQLEAVMTRHAEERRRDLEQLSVLRIQVASCLETSIDALRAATQRVASTELSTPPPRLAREAFSGVPSQSMSGGRRGALIAAGSAAMLIFAVVMYQYQPRASERPTADVAKAGHEISAPLPSPAPSGSAAPAIQEQVEGLVLALTARYTCWIGISIDGGQRLERVLKPDETIMLRAEQEAVLRVGDAAALSVLINSQPAKPLAAAGQAVTARITRANYLSFLADR